MTETISTLKSPRAAAAAGIVFSILSFTVMFMVQDLVTGSSSAIDKQWFETHARSVSFPLTLVPFIGISLLWFTGVLRDWLDDKEDRFFSTIFFGSGILIVGMLFIWAAVFGAMFQTYLTLEKGAANPAVFVFSHTFLRAILGDFTLRLMGVYMTSIATIWRLTKVMPRWILIITYAFGIAFIILAAKVPEARYVFPGWVFVVSSYILVANLRRPRVE